jgi:DNA-nicking Smr family endonuclease
VRPKTRFVVLPEDIELFRKTVGKVKPLRQIGVAEQSVAAPRRRIGRARISRAQRLAGLDESLANGLGDALDVPMVGAHDVLSHRRPGVPETVLRALRRGDYPIEGELDLHGMTLNQAKRALHGFLSSALARHLGCVRIIHGKGLRSGSDGPVLKTTVNALLRKTSSVVAYVSARPADGGTGAVYVLLAQSR